jgi:SpoIID/LytB domain protein
MQQGYRNVQSNKRRSRSGSYYQRRKEPTSNSSFLSILLCICLIGGSYLYFDQNAFNKVFTYIQIGKTYIEEVIQTKILKQEIDTQTQIAYYAPVCIEANIAKIVAYTLLEKQIEVGSEVQGEWYTPYYNLLAEEKVAPFLEEKNATRVVTLEKAYLYMQEIIGDKFNLNVTLNENTKNEPITLKQFLEIYTKTMEQTKISSSFVMKEISILGTAATLEGLNPWVVATDKGEYGFKGLMLDAFKDYTVSALMAGKEILGIVDILKDEAIMSNALIKQIDQNKIVLEMNARDFSYSYAGTPTFLEGQKIDVTIQKGQILTYQVREVQDGKSGERVLRITDEYIEFQEAGRVPYKEVEVVDQTGKTRQNIKQLVSGMQVECSIQDGYLQKIDILGEPDKQVMRILISEDGLGEYKHKQLVVTSEEAFEILFKEESIVLEAGTIWDSRDFLWEEAGDKIIFKSHGEGALQVTSLIRRGQVPEYAGSLEVYKEEEGFLIVNELELEEYIAGVIGSEMPTSYGLEAAKVQAVAARSYALAHQSSTKYTKYGAQVDDTTATQVYNHVKTDEIALLATQQTAGEVLHYHDQIISGNFFAASCGSTANFGEVWASGEVYPSNTPIYLVANKQYAYEDDLHLNKEEDAYTFFTKTAHQIDAFDNHSPWFRWQLELTREELQQIINRNIYTLSVQYPSLIKVLDSNKEWASKEIESIGELDDLKIEKRGQGGNIMELIVEGSNATVKISTEYLIRCLLAPVQKEAGGRAFSISRSDGSRVENMSMLPSAFFVIELKQASDKKDDQITLFGGGFGHGVGMSQEGVKGMIERGYTYKAILQHYYRNVEVDTF